MLIYIYTHAWINACGRVYSYNICFFNKAIQRLLFYVENDLKSCEP